MSKLNYPTFAGLGALLIWSLSAVITTNISNIPLFETMIFIFGTSFACVAIKLTICNEWYKIRGQPLALWIFGVLGLCGSDIAYVKAVALAPTEHIELIDYFWPFLVIVFTSLLPNEKFSFKYVVAGICGLAGVYILLNNGESAFDFIHIQGYMIAFGGALAWSCYVLVTRFYQNAPAELIGMYCGVGCLLSVIVHLKYEVTVSPSYQDCLLAMFLGLGASGIAYLLWDTASKKGNIQLLGTLSYFTPIISMGLLVYFGKTQLTHTLILACFMVILGVVIGSVNWGPLFKFFKRAFR